MKRKVPVLLLAVLLLVFAAYGCNDDTPPATSTPVSGAPSTSVPAAGTSVASTLPASIPSGSVPAASTAVSSTPASVPVSSTPATSTPAASTLPASIPATSTPATSVPAASTAVSSVPATVPTDSPDNVTNPDGTRTVQSRTTDLEFVVPMESFRIAATAPAYTTGIIVAGAVDKLVALDESIGNNPWILDKFPQLADLPVVFAGNATNLEGLLETEPDLVFYAPRYGTETEAQLNDIDGVTVINNSSNGLATADYTPMELVYHNQWFYGAIIGGDSGQLADAYVEYFDNAKTEIAAIVDTIPESERPRVMVLNATDPLTSVSGEGIGQNYIEMGGGLNVGLGAPGLSGTTGAIEVSMEQVMAWDPQVILTSPQQRDEIMNDTAWSTISAVKDGRVYIIPAGSMGWSGNGPEEALMFQWTATVFHPDKFAHIDMRERAREFYQTFMGLELDETDIDQIFTRDFD